MFSSEGEGYLRYRVGLTPVKWYQRHCDSVERISHPSVRGTGRGCLKAQQAVKTVHVFAIRVLCGAASSSLLL